MHLIVFVHGFNGSGSDFDNMEKSFLSQLIRSPPPEPVFVLKANSNGTLSKTSDGIEKGAIRIWREIMSLLNSRPDITSISFISHSLGGLYSRYVCRLLDDCQVFDKVRPKIFITLATPHLSTRRPVKQRPLNYFFQSLAQNVCQTTQELFLEDSTALLLKMTDPHYVKALAKFTKRVLYSNVWNDFQVHYSTSSISTRNPYSNGQRLERSQYYPSITQWSIEAVDSRLNHVDAGEFAFTHDEKTTELRMMFTRLNELSWERYDCVFHTVFAHEQIVNKRNIFSGEDVTRHVYSHFTDDLARVNNMASLF